MTEGLPIGYRLFDGSTYEGRTLIPVLKDLKQSYSLNKIVFVGDSGLRNEQNLLELKNKNSLDDFENNKIYYIVGTRIRNLVAQLKEKVLNPDNYTETSNGESCYFQRFYVGSRENFINQFNSKT